MTGSPCLVDSPTPADVENPTEAEAKQDTSAADSVRETSIVNLVGVPVCAAGKAARLFAGRGTTGLGCLRIMNQLPL